VGDAVTGRETVALADVKRTPRRFRHPVTGAPMTLVKVYAGSVLVERAETRRRETWSRATRVRLDWK
jgi:hypothetical protein